MALAPGTRFGPYEITAQIGAGGMGEVYRATDTNLKRSVATKVLPESVAGDPERLARFQREAELLASLNHPNIAAIYGLERSEGTTALIMELVEGPTLADRIAQGPIPVDEALAIAKQIAEALEAAHEQGIIHRDLKPANIKVRDDGTVKVLDFGLAKALEPMGAGSSPENTHSPTLTSPALSQVGVILGTAAYMSPEQARGKPVDRRADVWAFGAVLYEMLTGRRAFAGEDMTDTLAAVVRSEPSWEALPKGLSPTLGAYLRRCLQKDPKQRLHDIADMRLALEGAFDVSGTPDRRESGRHSLNRSRILTFIGAVAVMMAGILIGRFFFGATATPEEEPIRLTMDLEPGHRLSTGIEVETGRTARHRPAGRTFALSPDGRVLVYVASDGATTRLFRRPMDQMEATSVPGTEGAHSPIFSPDGEAVAVFVGTDVKRVSMESGEVRSVTLSGPLPELGPTASWALGSWTTRDTILLGSRDGVYELPANGGSVKRLTTGGSPDWVASPQLLPGGEVVLFSATEGYRQWGVIVESLQSGERRVVVERGTDPRYVPSGHILFMRDGTLMAVAFDLVRLEATGPPIVVLEDVMHAEGGDMEVLNTGAGQFSVSKEGTLAYVPGGRYPIPLTQIVWVDHSGASEPLPLPGGTYYDPRFSPDGQRLLYTRRVEGENQIWVYNIALDTPSRLTTDGEHCCPFWSPDGRRAIFTEIGRGRPQMFTTAVDGSDEPQVLFPNEASQFASSCSSTGVLTFIRDDDIWTASLDGTGVAKSFVETPFREWWPTLSPDGRWLAYASDRTERFEVYVRPFPGGEPAHRVSTAGGIAPLWAPDGNRLFFRTLEEGDTPEDVMVVDVIPGAAFSRSQPRVLFDSRSFDFSGPHRGYDISPDGRRFAMYTRPPETEPQAVKRIHVVLNWFEELNELVPAN